MGKQCQTLFWGAPKSLQMVTAAIKLKDTYLLLGRKAITNLNSILKSKYITLLTKVCIFKAMFFLVVMYTCERWTIKKAECWRTEAFEMWCWRRLLRGPWIARRSNQTILKEISPEYSVEGLMLKLKLQCFGHLGKEDSWHTGKDPDAGKDWGQDGVVGWHHWLNGHEFEQTLRDTEEQGILACCSLSSIQFSHSVVSDPLGPHGLQHARLPFPSLSSRVCSSSCPLGRWCSITDEI